MNLIRNLALAALLLAAPASAQTVQPGGGSSISTPVSTTNGGTGLAGTLTGARKANGASADTQAATSDLSDVTAPTAWTPADASGAALTFTSVTAAYTKVGKQVTLTMRVVFPTTASGASVAISGLPVAASSAAYGAGVNTAAGICNGNIATNAMGVALLQSGATQFTVVNNAGNNVVNSTLTAVAFSCTLTYISS